MKQFYFFLILSVFFTYVNYGQSPIITMISDGDCSGGNPKVLEIYADGVVDFSLYSIQNQTNANTTWGTPVSLSPLGTVTDDFVYVYQDSNNNTVLLDQEYPASIGKARMASSVMNLNGDDRIRIILASNSSVIDQYGEDGVDGTGTAWETLDGYAKRNSGTGPDAVFVVGNWTFALSGLDTKGICQGSDSFETVMGGIQTYSPTPPAGINHNEIPGFSLYPNPVSNQLFIHTEADLTKNIQIFDLLGKQVLNRTIEGSSLDLNIPAGIYMIKVEEAGKVTSQKLVVK